MEQLLTVFEAANMLRVQPVTIRKWVYEGRLPCCRLSRRVVFRARDLDDFIEKNYHPAKEVKTNE
jgi:excisionase family DNA binding protein